MGILSMAMDDSSKPLGTWKILWEALKIPTKNWRLMLSIMLLSLLPSSLLFFGNYLSVHPLLTDLLLKNLALSNDVVPGSPEYWDLLAGIKKDFQELTAVEAVFLLISFLITSIILIAFVYAIAMTYTGKNSTLRKLFDRIKRSWKGPMITRFYVNVLGLGYTIFLLVLIGVFVLISNGSMVLIALGVVVVLLALFLSIYLATVWSLSLVVSVVEEGCYGLAALGRATELIKGKKRQGFAINLILMTVISVFYVAYNLLMVSAARSVMTQLAIGLGMVSLSVLSNMFILAANTVFYYECKKSHGEEEEAVKGGFGYSILPTTTEVDATIP